MAPASTFEAAAKAAALRAHLENVEEREDDEPDDEDELGEGKELDEVEQRLHQVLEINRSLRANVARKHREVEVCTDKVKYLELVLHGRAQEEPARRLRVEDLQIRVGGIDDTGRRAARELEKFLKEAQKLEEKIETLNAQNLKLSDMHGIGRTKLQEQQSRLRTCGRRERELAKQLDDLAGQFNSARQAALAAIPAMGIEEDDKTQTRNTLRQVRCPRQLEADKRVLALALGEVDYRNLQGISVQKLTSIKSQAAPHLQHAEFQEALQRSGTVARDDRIGTEVQFVEIPAH